MSNLWENLLHYCNNIKLKQFFASGWCIETQTFNSEISSYNYALHEKCPNTELFLVRIFRIRTKYGEILQSECGKIRTRNNSVFGHLSRSDGSAAEYKNRNRLQHSLKNPQNLFNANKKETRKNFRLCSGVIFVDFKQILANWMQRHFQPLFLAKAPS